MGQFLCLFHLTFCKRFCKRRQVFSEREQYRSREFRSLDDFHLQVHDAGDMCSMTGNFTIALHRMHIPEIYPATWHFYRADQHGTFPDTVYIHVSIGPFFKLFFCHAVVMWRIDQELSEIARIMGVGESAGWCRSQLAEERDDPCHGTDDVMRCKSHYGMLDGIFRSAHVSFTFTGDNLRIFLVEGQTNGPLSVKRHRIGICKGERGDIPTAFSTPYRTLTDAIDFRFRVFGAAAGADPGNKRIPCEPALHRLVIA